MIDFTTLHNAVLNASMFAQSAVYTPAGGGAKGITVIVSLKPEELSLGADLTPQAIAGKAGCRSSDVAGAKLNDVLEIDTVTYGILGVQADETGWTELYLGKKY